MTAEGLDCILQEQFAVRTLVLFEHIWVLNITASHPMSWHCREGAAVHSITYHSNFKQNGYMLIKFIGLGSTKFGGIPWACPWDCPNKMLNLTFHWLQAFVLEPCKYYARPINTVQSSIIGRAIYIPWRKFRGDRAAH